MSISNGHWSEGLCYLGAYSTAMTKVEHVSGTHNTHPIAHPHNWAMGVYCEFLGGN